MKSWKEYKYEYRYFHCSIAAFDLYYYLIFENPFTLLLIRISFEEKVFTYQ